MSSLEAILSEGVVRARQSGLQGSSASAAKRRPEPPAQPRRRRQPTLWAQFALGTRTSTSLDEGLRPPGRDHAPRGSSPGRAHRPTRRVAPARVLLPARARRAAPRLAQRAGPRTPGGQQVMDLIARGSSDRQHAAVRVRRWPALGRQATGGLDQDLSVSYITVHLGVSRPDRV
eukprot:scaffold330_cov396-Prasinococcus_capsulatus_cf.AAC.1